MSKPTPAAMRGYLLHEGSHQLGAIDLEDGDLIVELMSVMNEFKVSLPRAIANIVAAGGFDGSLTYERETFKQGLEKWRDAGRRHG